MSRMCRWNVLDMGRARGVLQNVVILSSYGKLNHVELQISQVIAYLISKRAL